MSSEISSMERKQNATTAAEDKTIKWTARLTTSRSAHRYILEKATREDRSPSFIISKMVEAYCEENASLKVVT